MGGYLFREAGNLVLPDVFGADGVVRQPADQEVLEEAHCGTLCEYLPVLWNIGRDARKRVQAQGRDGYSTY